MAATTMRASSASTAGGGAAATATAASDVADSAALTAKLRGRKQHRSPEEEEEVRMGKHWAEAFKEKANVRDPEQVEKWLNDVKVRLLRRHPTISAAFRNLESPTNEVMAFHEFDKMLRRILMPMEKHVSRRLFERSSEGAAVLNVHKFKAQLMDRTIKKLGFVMKAFNANQDRIMNHTHIFLRRLARSDEGISLRAVERFQQKISIKFCREFWTTILGYASKTKKRDVLLDPLTFERLVKRAFHLRFEGFPSYDVDFVSKIYNRIQEKCVQVSVSLNEIIVTLLLMSPENDRMAKMELIFEMFDGNYAGCLQFDQIHSMVQMLCKLRPVAEDSHVVNPAEEVAPIFEEELAQQESLRVYEQIRWHLQRRIQVHDIVSFSELWIALESNPGLLEALLPAAMRIRWVADPPVAELPMGLGPAGGEEESPDRALSAALMDLGEASHRRASVQRPGSRGSRGSRAHTPQSTDGRAGSRRRASVARLSGVLTSSSGFRSFASDGSAELRSNPFRIERAQGFASSLRKSKSRLPEMIAGFAKPPEFDELDGLDTHSLMRTASAPEMVPLPTRFKHMKLGGEADSRIRLYSASRAAIPQHRLKPIVVGGSGAPFKCQVCHGEHVMQVDCKPSA